MQVDVEGWEWSVMKGGAEMFKKFKVDNVIMEYSPGEGRRVYGLVFAFFLCLVHGDNAPVA